MARRVKENQDQKLRVFLCHYVKDKRKVLDLYNQLASVKGVDPWVDEKKLLPGHDWEYELKAALRESHVAIIFLSKRSIQHEGYVYKEIRLALDVAKEKPEGTIYIIPLKLEPCTPPSMLAQWQWLDYYDEGGYEKLIKSLVERARKFKIKIGDDSIRVSTGAKKRIKHDQTHPQIIVIYLSDRSTSIKPVLENWLHQNNLSASYTHAKSISEIDVTTKGSKYAFWIVDKKQPHYHWKPKEGIELLKQRRNNFVFLLEKSNIPEELTAFHCVDLSKATKREQQLNFLYQRMQTIFPKIYSNDLFIQTILEELIMGKIKYSSTLPRVNPDTSIFAAMYFSGQIQEYEQLLSHLNELSDDLPETDFQDREFVRDLRRTLSQLAKYSAQIQQMIDLGLKVDPEHRLGIEIHVRTSEISRLIENEITPLVENHLGRPGNPSNLNIRIQDLSQSAEELVDRLYKIANSLRRALVK